MLCAIGRAARSCLVHSCSPRTLRVAHDESSLGGGNNRGLTKNQAPTETASRQLRSQTGSGAPAGRGGAHDESSLGGGNNRGLTKNQAPTETAWSQLRFQTGRGTPAGR